MSVFSFSKVICSQLLNKKNKIKLFQIYQIYNLNLDIIYVQVYKFCGIDIGCALLAVIVIAIGLDPITLDREYGRKRQISFHLVFETAKHLWRSHYQKLLVILTMYSGVEQAFFTTDYTKVCYLSF